MLLVVVEISIRTFEYAQDNWLECQTDVWITCCTNWNKESQVFGNDQIREQVCVDLHSKLEKYDVIRLNSPNQHFPTLNINSEGFRGSEISKEKPNDVYRIFVIGGSTTFGMGATSDETTIPGFLQEFYDKDDLNFRVEVINAGIVAAYSTVEAYYIKNTILEFEPDLIIAYVGVNDAGDVSVKEEIDTNVVSSFDIRQILFYRTPFFLYEHLGLYTEVEDLYSNLDANFISKRTDLWKNNWLDVCKFGKDNNFKTIVAVQPMLGTGDRVFSSHEQLLLSNQNQKQKQINVMTEGLNGFAKSLNELDKECTATGDFRNVFDGINAPIYYDDIHTSDFGNKIIAQNLFDLSLPILFQE